MTGEGEGKPEIGPPEFHPVCPSCKQEKLCSAYFPESGIWEVNCLGCNFFKKIKAG
jgi:hypothetical protein